MTIDTTKIDRFALKAEIRARQAACHAINIEYHKTKKKLADLHKKLVTEYIAEHGSRMWKAGERSGCQKFLDQHVTYQSITRELQDLRNARYKQRIDWELQLAHCYLKGNTYEGSGAGGLYSGAVYAGSIAKWIPGCTEETKVCIKIWLAERTKTRAEIEAFGIETDVLRTAEEKLRDLERQVSKFKTLWDEQASQAYRAKRYAEETAKAAEEAAKGTERAHQSYTNTLKGVEDQKRVIGEARKALEAKREATFGKAAAA